jgi:hypothetical protein
MTGSLSIVYENNTKQDELWALAHLWYPPPLFDKQEVGIWWVPKRFPRYGYLVYQAFPRPILFSFEANLFDSDL